MANWYVWSGAAGAGDGTTWANAYTTLGAATVKPAGDVFFVAHDHAETAGATKTIMFLGTESNPNKVYCADRAGSVPPVSADLRTTAQVITTGAFGISVGGTVSEFYGIIFNCGTGATAATLVLGNGSSRTQRFVNCSFRLLTTSGTSRIHAVGASSANLVVLENCTMQFGSISQFAQVSGRIVWRNTPNAILGATIPSILLSASSSGGSWFIEGVDLSAMGASKQICSVSTSTPSIYILKDCKFGVSVIPSSAPNLSAGGCEVTIIHCDSGDTTYRTEKYAWAGTLTTETTIVRTGGASDGTTPISWKVVTSSNAKPELPFECLPITIWNDTIGSAITVTVYACSNTVLPTNKGAWINVQYFGTSGFPMSSKVTNTTADGLATATTYSTDDSTWGGSPTNVWKMAVTFTPQEKGPLTIYVYFGGSSTTYYVDPKPVIT